MAELVIVKKDEGNATVLLNRPEAFNAFDQDMVNDLARNLITLATDKDVRAIIISGKGKAFCAGGDLKWALAVPKGPSAAFHELASSFHSAVLEIRRMPKPVIASIRIVIPACLRVAASAKAGENRNPVLSRPSGCPRIKYGAGSSSPA